MTLLRSTGRRLNAAPTPMTDGRGLRYPLAAERADAGARIGKEFVDVECAQQGISESEPDGKEHDPENPGRGSAQNFARKPEDGQYPKPHQREERPAAEAPALTFHSHGRERSGTRGVNEPPIWGEGSPSSSTIPRYERASEFRQTLLVERCPLLVGLALGRCGAR